jgi:hypothetical protein
MRHVRLLIPLFAAAATACSEGVSEPLLAPQFYTSDDWEEWESTYLPEASISYAANTYFLTTRVDGNANVQVEAMYAEATITLELHHNGQHALTTTPVTDANSRMWPWQMNSANANTARGLSNSCGWVSYARQEIFWPIIRITSRVGNGGAYNEVTRTTQRSQRASSRVRQSMTVGKGLASATIASSGSGSKME